MNIYGTAGSLSYLPVLTVPANQRLVVKQISGMCNGIAGLGAYVSLSAKDQSQNPTGLLFLSKDFTVDFTPANDAIEFFVGRGEELGIKMYDAAGQDGGVCLITVSGYFVNLP